MRRNQVKRIAPKGAIISLQNALLLLQVLSRHVPYYKAAILLKEHITCRKRQGPGIPWDPGRDVSSSFQQLISSVSCFHLDTCGNMVRFLGLEEK